MANPPDSVIKDVLTKYKRITVVGLSPQPDRPSYGVTEYMINQGYEISGVRPGGLKEVLRRPMYETLDEVPEPLEIVNVFRAPEFIPEVVDDVLKTGAKVLWLQLGITHPEAEERARKAGLTVISNRCILVEHRRLMS
ncbi:MAG TPA: CoA-binding protein [Bdellovibrionales bacterium]|nr:CoA-binding protein [Bdellovibrionales bacterium]